MSETQLSGLAVASRNEVGANGEILDAYCMACGVAVESSVHHADAIQRSAHASSRCAGTGQHG